MKTAAKILNQSTDNTTSTENMTFSKEVLKTDICKCGKEYASHYISHLFGKSHEFNADMCDECSEERAIEQQRLEYEETQKKYRRQSNKRKFDEDSLVNPKLKKATFSTYQPTNEDLTKAKAICQRYADNFDYDNPVNLLLIGNYGTGKSHLSVSICKQVIEELAYGALFISTPKLLTKIRSTYNRRSEETEDEIIDQLSRVTLLVLDDIGSEQSKPTNDDNEQSWATSKIFEIIDNRIGKHTIFTSNFTIPELQQRMGGRNFSRMMESTHIVKMYGDDYRLKDFK